MENDKNTDRLRFHCGCKSVTIRTIMLNYGEAINFMVTEVFYIVTSDNDREYGGEIDYFSGIEYKAYPSVEEIEKALKETNRTHARIEKRYKLSREQSEQTTN